MKAFTHSARVANELAALAFDVLYFLRQIDESAKKSSGDQKIEILLMAEQAIERAGRISETAEALTRKGAQNEELAIANIRRMRKEISEASDALRNLNHMLLAFGAARFYEGPGAECPKRPRRN